LKIGRRRGGAWPFRSEAVQARAQSVEQEFLVFLGVADPAQQDQGADGENKQNKNG